MTEGTRKGKEKREEKREEEKEMEIERSREWRGRIERRNLKRENII